MSGAASAFAGRFQGFWNHPAGPKTVHFWAPMMKWGLVIAGISDFNRPAEKLSITQTISLTLTGMIWVRYSFVIIPVNYSLASVNFFLAGTGLVQLGRIWDYRRKNPNYAQLADKITETKPEQLLSGASEATSSAKSK